MSKVTALQTQMDSQAPANMQHFDQKQIEILKNSICRGVSNEEFEIFLMACRKTQLDPFMKQIYAVKRKSKKPDGSWGETMTIQTGIDGYRLIAERTGCYTPGPEPTYGYDSQGKLESATAYIKKQTRDGTWHTVSASAFIDEYCQKTKEGHPIGMWNNMPRTMLAKCAEAQALRKAFPAEMSGVYTKEEMSQAETHEIVISKISPHQVIELETILDDCEPQYKRWVFETIKKMYGAESLSDVPADVFDRMKNAAVKNMEAHYKKQQEESNKSQHTELVMEEVK